MSKFLPCSPISAAWVHVLEVSFFFSFLMFFPWPFRLLCFWSCTVSKHHFTRLQHLTSLVCKVFMSYLGTGGLPWGTPVLMLQSLTFCRNCQFAMTSFISHFMEKHNNFLTHKYCLVTFHIGRAKLTGLCFFLLWNWYYLTCLDFPFVSHGVCWV